MALSASARRPRLPPLEAKGEKPLFFFFVVALLNIVDSFNLNIVWPLLPFMVDSYGVARTEEDLGAWVGAAGAAVSVGQLLSSYAWGALSDRIGRRPVMLMGMCNSTFSVLVFGTAKTYAQCLAGRFLSGLLNGNAGVVKTYVGETTEKSQQTVAFSIFAVAFGFASCVAPAVGGFLQRPAERWPEVFENTVFESYPFLLPMLCAASLTAVGGVLGFFYAPETASQWRRMEKRRAETSAANAESNAAFAFETGRARKQESRRVSIGDVALTKIDDARVRVDRDETEAVKDCEDDDEEDEEDWTKRSLLLRASQEGIVGHEANAFGNVSKRRVVSWTTPSLRETGWDVTTVTASVSYAWLAFIAIGYDEILPVYAKTSRELGGLSFSAAQIGAVLVVGGFALLFFQLLVFPRVLRRFGVTKCLRSASLLFAFVSLIAPAASVHWVERRRATKWSVLLVSQTCKIATLAVLFTTVIMAVNNSCLNRVKARVNGAATSFAAFGRIVSPVIHGLVFSASLKLKARNQQFLVFCFVSACAVGLFFVTSRLPKSLDQPPREAEEEESAMERENERSTELARFSGLEDGTGRSDRSEL